MPVEQRTAKPRKPKVKKKPPKDAFAWKSQAKADSRPVGNPGLTSENTDTPTATASRAPGGYFPTGYFPTGRESPIRKKRLTNQGRARSAASEAIESGNDGWLDSPKAEPPSAADGPDPDGVRLLRSLSFGVGDKLAGHAVEKWSHVVGSALRADMDERTVIAKLTDDLPTGSVAQRVRIVVGRRLPDLAADVEQAPRRAISREFVEQHRADLIAALTPCVCSVRTGVAPVRSVP